MGLSRIRILAVCGAAAAQLIASGPVEAKDEQIFQLIIKGNGVPSHQRTIRVTRGDAASIEAQADRPVVLHVHGLKIELEVKPGVPTRVRIPTRATGRFRVELHERGAAAKADHHGAPLAFVEIMPK